MKILGYILVIFVATNFASSFADETKLKLRGSSNTETSIADVTLKIYPEMLVIKEFKKTKNDYKALKAHAKELDKVNKFSQKKIKMRGAGKTIYSQYAESVVFIGNFETKMVGSGSLIDKSGLILTNWHVTDKADTVAVWVKPKSGPMDEDTLFTKIDPYLGAVVAENLEQDLALIKISNYPKRMKVIPFSADKDIEVGDDVYAIGHPSGLPWTFTRGSVSQIREDHQWTYEDGSKHKATLIQTQTPISPGNSGGPLFSEKGKLVGVNTLKAGGENLNFAVAIKHAKEFIKKNPGLKKINPAEILMKKDYPNAKIEDYNKNGTIDTWYVDENNNGKTDIVFVDDNEDGIIEGILIDENENGVYEITFMDDDNNGKPDRALLDEDEDKKIDVVGYDYDQDGKWDQYKKVS